MRNGETEVNRNGNGGPRKNWGRRGFAMVRRTNRKNVRTSTRMETGNLAERWGACQSPIFPLPCIAKAPWEYQNLILISSQVSWSLRGSRMSLPQQLTCHRLPSSDRLDGARGEASTRKSSVGTVFSVTTTQ